MRGVAWRSISHGASRLHDNESVYHRSSTSSESSTCMTEPPGTSLKVQQSDSAKVRKRSALVLTGESLPRTSLSIRCVRRELGRLACARAPRPVFLYPVLVLLRRIRDRGALIQQLAACMRSTSKGNGA